MKKMLLISLLFVMIGCTPVRYVMIDPKDSTKLIEVKKRTIYHDTYLESPMYFNYWGDPFRFNYLPRIVVPIRPYRINPPVRIQPQPGPRPMPRGGRH